MTPPGPDSAPERLRHQLVQAVRSHVGSRRAPRVAVLGNIGNGNTGDEALLAVALAALGRRPVVTVLSRDPARTTAMHGVRAVPLLGLTAALVLVRCHAVVVVGGGMFGPGLPPLVRLLPHLLDSAAMIGRAVAYVGIGVYTGLPHATLAALRRSMTRATVTVTVRDRASATLLSASAPPPCVGDLAHHLPSTRREDAQALLRASGVDPTRPLLLLAPKAGTSGRQTRAVVDAAALAAAHWRRLGGTVAGIALSDHADHGIPPADHDAALVERVGAHAGVGVPVLGPNLHPALARAVVGKAAAVVSHRFHGVVFAAAEGVPAIAYAWEPKTVSFLAEHGQAELSDPLVPQELENWLTTAFGRATAARPARAPSRTSPRRPDQMRLEVRAAAER